MQYFILAMELFCGVLGLIALALIGYLAVKFWQEGSGL